MTGARNEISGGNNLNKLSCSIARMADMHLAQYSRILINKMELEVNAMQLSMACIMAKSAKCRIKPLGGGDYYRNKPK